MNNFNIGKMLVEEKMITKDQLNEVLSVQRKTFEPLEHILLDHGYITETDVLKFTTRKLGLEFIDDPSQKVDQELQNIVSEAFLKRHEIVPLFIKEGTLTFASADPFNFEAMENLSMMTGMNTNLVVSSSMAIESAINKLHSYGKIDDDNLLGEIEISTEDKALIERVESAPVVKLVNSIITHAYEVNASDIHINPEETYTNVKFRIDGQLKDFMKVRRELHDPMITRIKIISSMNIAEKRIPQDGAFRIDNPKMKLDMRVATIPSGYGEKVVMRLLGSEKNIDYDLDKLDLSDSIKRQLRDIMQLPNGILLITGPTGSGKTTTLYSMLSEINAPEKSVITIEDPVEKHFEGISQVTINNKAGLTFSSGLRSILRLDPDVIMVGEIRDAETASIAIRAAITGHFVLSTLHTNDALSSVTRLIDMGVEPFLVASSVKCVIAQRLVRKNCRHCKHKVAVSESDRIALKEPSLSYQFKGEGCDRCNHTGYAGRTAVFEVVPIDATMQNLITQQEPMHKLVDYARSRNIAFLRDDVMRLVKGGDTTVEEAQKILYGSEVVIDD
ncbi:type II/IV secretion system protein [Erysipelothrix inopinata]|uniref:Type II/IV secretion system protein n=1 Tax=Erysipelothrix inopinata TaxID=225084 RepID=A0A7G9RYZ5_9FIRM|nr:GspE/PulE family protein [Erysipelothrix inopinata]QNN60820.1 type II/IV secretion system protein [Erysipelothrix inopinata]